MLLAQLLVPYLALVNKTKLVKKNKMFDSAAKAVCGELSMASLLTVLALVYFKFAQARAAAARPAHRAALLPCTCAGPTSAAR